jgi:hypothetical protein
MFLFFSVARSAHTSQAERANSAVDSSKTAVQTDQATIAQAANALDAMPTEKLLDVSPLALRMSSPFNAGYWLSVA